MGENVCTVNLFQAKALLNIKVTSGRPRGPVKVVSPPLRSGY